MNSMGCSISWPPSGTCRLCLVLLLCTSGTLASAGAEQQPKNVTDVRPCMKVKDGYCVEEVLQEIYELQKPLWPAKIDVVMLMSTNHAYQAQLVFRNMELFWPRYLGTVNIVLDAGCEWLVPILPEWVHVHFIDWKANVPGISMWIAKEWWEFWMDTVSTAPYLAFLDSDGIFDTPLSAARRTLRRYAMICRTLHQKGNFLLPVECTMVPYIVLAQVTPDMVFNPTNGNKLRMISRLGGDRYRWAPNTDFLLGKGTHAYDFMSALPWFFPRAWMKEMRDDILAHHPEVKGDISILFEEWNLVDKKQVADSMGRSEWGRPENANRSISWMIATFSTQGNWAWRKKKDEIDWAIEGETGDYGKTPLWMSKHISYSRRYDLRTNGHNNNKLHADAGKATASYIYEGLCSAFPPDTVAGCSAAASMKQENILEFESRLSAPVNDANMQPVKRHFALLHAMYPRAIASLQDKAARKW